MAHLALAMHALPQARRIVNMSTRKVGGLRFLKVGRLTVSWSVSRSYRPL